MTWQDRQYASDDDPHSGWGKPGGDWAGVRPSIDNPLTWSLPLARVGGITIRIHLLFLAYIIIELGKAALPNQEQPINLTLMALAMGLLVVIVLAHELGHCLACRAVGGAADEILMWPLGGLAFCQPPMRWQAHLITAAGGPLVNVIICALSGGILGWLTGMWTELAVLNPLNLSEFLFHPRVSRSWAHVTLYLMNGISLIMLLFNLLPVFPLDGGRLVQALLWSRLGWSGSMRWTVRIGYIGALAMCLFGAVSGEWMIIAVGGFGLAICYLTHRQLEFSDSVVEDEPDDDYPTSVYGGTEAAEEEHARPVGGLTATSTRAERAAQRRAQQEVDEAADVDRILLKIAQQGMASLTQGEKNILQRATERKRKES